MNFVLNAGAINFSAMFDKAANIFKSFQLRDLIDILLVTVILFLAVNFLKGRKAGTLLLGIVVCFVVLIVSDIFKLTLLHSLFSKIIGSGTIVLLVLFQPEIREALEKIGNGSLQGITSFSDRRRRKELYFNVIENICTAVKGLSLESTGALIVVERTTRLSDIISSGITINADVNSALLRNLFYNRAPLHDGAVVISEGRITAAGCFLPLTRRTDVDPDLGTRHRAAIGMSESSDAIIIIVSEETGNISIAHDCTLLRNLTPDDVKAHLSEYLLGVRRNSTSE